MSTRCQIGIYEDVVHPVTEQRTDGGVYIFRHVDGMPGTVNGSKAGILPDIVPYLKKFNKYRGINDIEYCSARLLQHLCNLSDTRIGEEESVYHYISHGITTMLYDGIEYFYHVSQKVVKVYKTNFSLEQSDWELVKQVKLSGDW